MLDALLRRAIDPPLDYAAKVLAPTGVSANALTLSGCVVGLATVPLLAVEAYGWALGAIAINRILDGLDGAVARRAGATDRGGALDIACDMLFYAAVPLGFALARPENAVWAALLLAAFMGTSAAFFALAVVAAKRGTQSVAQGRKSFFYAAGLAEGSETILALAAMCLAPDYFAWIAGAFAILCGLTILQRLAAIAALDRDG